MKELKKINKILDSIQKKRKKNIIKNFKNKDDEVSQDVVYEFQLILESMEKQAECIVDIF